MSRLIDLTGQRFNRLTVVKRAADYIRPSGKRSAMYECLCDCGNTIIAHSSTLKNGDTQSCGCLNRELAAQRLLKHGATKTKLFDKWCGMKQRCYNPNTASYSDYGGRGITLCAEWLNDFEAFQNWAMSTGYRAGLSIDRIDNDKGYCPDNCRWVTLDAQKRNTRRNVQLVDGNAVILAADLAKMLDISNQTVYRWIAEHGYTSRAEVEEHLRTKYQPQKTNRGKNTQASGD